ncbi:MAG: hypothetical protein ACM3QZ_06300 [Solirubrobacterales bacterium]
MKRLRNRSGSALVMTIVLAMVLLTIGTTMVLVNTSDTRTMSPSGQDQSESGVASVLTPYADPPESAQPLEADQNVTLRTQTPGATIYFTRSDLPAVYANPDLLANPEPGGAGVQSGANSEATVAVNPGLCTIKAVAYLNNKRSKMATFTYKKKPQKPSVTRNNLHYTVTAQETIGDVVYLHISGNVSPESAGNPAGSSSPQFKVSFTDALSYGSTNLKAQTVIAGVYSDPTWGTSWNAVPPVPKLDYRYGKLLLLDPTVNTFVYYMETSSNVPTADTKNPEKYVNQWTSPKVLTGNGYIWAVRGAEGYPRTIWSEVSAPLPYNFSQGVITFKWIQAGDCITSDGLWNNSKSPIDWIKSVPPDKFDDDEPHVGKYLLDFENDYGIASIYYTKDPTGYNKADMRDPVQDPFVNVNCFYLYEPGYYVFRALVYSADGKTVLARTATDFELHIEETLAVPGPPSNIKKETWFSSPIWVLCGPSYSKYSDPVPFEAPVGAEVHYKVSPTLGEAPGDAILWQTGTSCNLNNKNSTVSVYASKNNVLSQTETYHWAVNYNGIYDLGKNLSWLEDLIADPPWYLVPVVWAIKNVVKLIMFLQDYFPGLFH